MRFNMLQLLKYLRSYSTGKEFTDADILDWANTKVRSTGSQTCMKSFKVSHLHIMFVYGFKHFLLQFLKFIIYAEFAFVYLYIMCMIVTCVSYFNWFGFAGQESIRWHIFP